MISVLYVDAVVVLRQRKDILIKLSAWFRDICIANYVSKVLWKHNFFFKLLASSYTFINVPYSFCALQLKLYLAYLSLKVSSQKTTLCLTLKRASNFLS